MASKDFKQTAETVRANFQKHGRAMEIDIQMLIQSLLDVIDTKIVALKKLLKLRAHIRNVTDIAALDYLAKLGEASLQETSDSLEDLSSMVYEADQNSLPKQKCKRMTDISDILDPKKKLEQYIYHLENNKSQQSGDQQSQKKDSLIYLGKADYESVLDILNTVLKSYETQEDRIGKRRKTMTDLDGEIRDEKKAASDSVCLGTKRLKNNKKLRCSI